MRRLFNALGGMYNQPFFEEDGGDGGGGDGGDKGEGGGEGSTPKTFTQAELDAKIADRLARERKKYEGFDGLKAEHDRLKAEEDTRKAALLTETERLQAEKDEANRKASDATDSAAKVLESANKRVIDAEIRSIARSLNAADVSDVLALVNKSGVSLDEETGNVVGVEEAVKALKEAKPHLFKAPMGADGSGGGNPNRGGNKSELAGKEAELEDLKKQAHRNPRLLGKVTALYNEIIEIKAKL